MSQTEKLLKYLLKSRRISDHQGWAKIRVPNIRSRICDIERDYKVFVNRARKKPKRYNEYWLSESSIQLLKITL